MHEADLVIRGRRVLLPDGEQSAAVHVHDGRIIALHPLDDEIPAGAQVVDAGHLVVLPGLVDTHVHVNEPGRTTWEGFATATRAAAAGGVTTIVDMPLNSVPPTTDVVGLTRKRAAAEGQVHVDVGFWGGAVPGNADDLADLHAAGVLGFKCFLVDSGVAEFGCLDGAGLRGAVAATAALGALLVVHAEAPGLIAAAQRRVRRADPRRYATWLDSRPDAAEVEACRDLADAVEDLGGRAHVLHVSSAAAAGVVAEARARGVAITAETCPHYLALAAEDIPDGATDHKCAPPIRDAANRDRLWQALADGAIDCVVSDHSPSTPERKAGDFRTAWGGIASLQVGLPVVWTAAADRGVALAEVVRVMATAPADLVGLHRKGRIAEGADADLVLFDPDATWTVYPEALAHRHPITPYGGRRLRGAVRRTWLRGAEVYRAGAEQHQAAWAPPQGRLLVREELEP
jgi:allantoinase